MDYKPRAMDDRDELRERIREIRAWARRDDYDDESNLNFKTPMEGLIFSLMKLVFMGYLSTDKSFPVKDHLWLNLTLASGISKLITYSRVLVRKSM